MVVRYRTFKFARRFAGAVALSVSLSGGLAHAGPVSGGYVVTSATGTGGETLYAAIQAANASSDPSFNITFDLPPSTTISELGSTPLPLIDNTSGTQVTIDGSNTSGLTISGGNTNRVFFVASGQVTISNLAIADGHAVGGNGGDGIAGGGGGLGAGGGVFVNAGAAVTLDTVIFTDNAATGGAGGSVRADSNEGGGGGGGLHGNGGEGGRQDLGPGNDAYGGGGGGGLYGNGGNAFVGSNVNSNGGGGGGGKYGNGGSTASEAGGGGGGAEGNGGNGYVDPVPSGFTGDSGGGGGGGPLAGQDGTNGSSNMEGSGAGTGGHGGTLHGLVFPTAGGVGGGGGGGGATQNGADGGAGGGGGGGGNGGGGAVGGVYAGGGGGGVYRTGGNGGDFGGGGGGSGVNNEGGGNGGYGGGGGGGAGIISPGRSAFGGGDGGFFYDSGGFGGSAYGGAVFVRVGGSLTLVNTSLSGGATTAGVGGSGATAGGDGSAAGDGIYLDQVTANFEVTTGTHVVDAIAGDGGLNKTGAGALDMIGVNTYTGPTDIQAGQLIVSGSLSSDTVVAGGALLSGNGVIESLTNNGTVAPGNSIGHLTVNTTYDSASGSTLQIEFNDQGTTPGTNVDYLEVGGQVTLNGGTVETIGPSGDYSAGVKYRFLSSTSTITGEFDGVTTNLGSSFLVELEYNEFYNSRYWVSFWITGSSQPDYLDFAQTQNQIAVANYLDQVAPGATGDLEVVIDGLNTLTGDPTAMRAAFGAISDEVTPTMAVVGLQNTTLVLQQISGQLRSGNFLTGSGYASATPSPSATPASRSPIMLVSYNKATSQSQVTFVSDQQCDCWKGWSFGYGLGGAASGDGNATGLNYGMGGMLLGAERNFNSAGRVGFFGGYQGTSLQLDGLAQTGKINGGMLGGYLYDDDGFNYYTAITGMQFSGYETTRQVQFDGINRTANGNFSGWQGYGYLERGVKLRSANTLLQPYVALQYIYLRQNNYTETGADTLNLAVSGIDANSLRSLIGGRWQYERGLYEGRLRPELRALWLHEFLDTDFAVNSYFAPIGGSSFAIQGLNLGRDWAIVGGGFRHELPSGWNLFANYDAQVNTQQVFHVGSGGAAYSW